MTVCRFDRRKRYGNDVRDLQGRNAGIDPHGEYCRYRASNAHAAFRVDHSRSGAARSGVRVRCDFADDFRD